MTAPRRDRTLLITGTTGIAAATARLAAEHGARVFLLGIDTASGHQLAEEIGPACLFQAADVTQAGEVGGGVAACLNAFGRIDGCFNVAGISGRRLGDGPIHECTEAGWDRTLESNAKSVFLTCRAVIRGMLQQPIDDRGMRGAILNMTSVLAFSPSPTHFATHAYAASKGAIIALTRSTAAYYAPHKIRINAIAPALVRTPMSQRAQDDPAILEYVRHKQPLSEALIDAADIARSALFLLGGDAGAITGEVLAVDAGWGVSA